MTYFNEFDSFAAGWLRELMADGRISRGPVDERSIADVAPDDVRRYRRAHFFAGIGGWELALELAGWPPNRPVWTGSCPCQPYSSAGKGAGDKDPRNIWPTFFALIRECRPQCVFGEQVEAAIRHGWLDRVCADLEREGYAVGACVLGAHSAGAPHIRHRLFWVANLDVQRCGAGRRREPGERRTDDAERLLHAGELGDTDRTGSRPGRSAPAADGFGSAALADGRARVVGHDASGGLRLGERCQQTDRQEPPDGGRMGDANVEHARGSASANAQEPTERRSAELGSDGRKRAVGVTQGDANCARPQGHEAPEPNEGRATGWADTIVIPCRDGKHRRVPTDPALFPLAHGVPNRVGLLRGAGNAIVPQVAAAFVRAFLETEG